MRHVQTRFLWLQERIACSHPWVTKVHTKDNVADILTKAMDGTALQRHMETMGFEFREGRAKNAKVLMVAANLHDVGEGFGGDFEDEVYDGFEARASAGASCTAMRYEPLDRRDGRELFEVYQVKCA